MSKQLGPIDIDCDALSYPIVKVCERLGFQSPLDVRWFRRSQLLKERREQGNFFSKFSWYLLFHGNQSSAKTCMCGKPLATLEQYSFLFPSGVQIEYFLGQCSFCLTMFWEKVSGAAFETDE